ncbi:hypothetical protein [Kitasatospora sp. NPDC008115]|uniref:hypothetical protein n=1 Tax=Kitasatospora sp. NPDC008115 TaxID=3364022 RepID=UPI0036EC66C6
METGEIGALLEEREARAWRRTRRSRVWGVHALGLAALGAWLWAVGLAFVPVTHEYPSGVREHCGSPMFYENVGADYRRVNCDDFTADRMRDAVVVGLATLPLSGVWLWRTVSMRLRRLEDRP